jgi:hypothetical protein
MTFLAGTLGRVVVCVFLLVLFLIEVELFLGGLTFGQSAKGNECA